MLKSILTFLLAAWMASALCFCGPGQEAINERYGDNNTSGNSDNSGNSGGNSSGGNWADTTNVIEIAEGNQAPDFSFTTIEGKTCKLSDYRGKVVFINQWASWCGPCMNEMPDIAKLHEQYPDVVILEVNVSDDESDAMAFIKSAGYDLTWIIDDGSISKLYPTEGIPYTVVLDKDGVIKTIYTGSSAAGMFGYFSQAVEAAGAKAGK